MLSMGQLPHLSIEQKPKTRVAMIAHDFHQVTVSTVGLVPEMQRFTASSRAQLAVSLHATTDEVCFPTWSPPSQHAMLLDSGGHAKLCDLRMPLTIRRSLETLRKAGLCDGAPQVRDWLCPVNRRWPLAVLLGALARDYPRRPNGAASRHFVLIEYVMLSGVNDTVDDAHRSV
jgi:23S rRNA (adenine2503-C2)-methyltransferase